MSAKKFFEKAFSLDQLINGKVQQLEDLNDLATKCTSTFTGMPRSSKNGHSMMADTIHNIVVLQEEINEDIDRLVDHKRKMKKVIGCLEKPEYQTVLELRYLCAYGCDRIADEMQISLHHVYKLLRLAMEAAEKWIPNDTK